MIAESAVAHSVQNIQVYIFFRPKALNGLGVLFYPSDSCNKITDVINYCVLTLGHIFYLQTFRPIPLIIVSIKVEK